MSSSVEYYRPTEELVLPPTYRPRYWLHALLLLLTVLTTLVVGARLEFNFQHGWPAFYMGDGSPDLFPWKWFFSATHLAMGIPFSLTLMLILLAHEMGHYLYCRRYRVAATLPFFIPFPTLIGTLGAFIRIRSPIRSRSELFDIGIAGPIAGFILSLIVLGFGLSISRTVPISGDVLDSSLQPTYPLIFSGVQWLLVILGISSHAVPVGRLLVHPSVIASWVGMFATSLNLLPGGQLDGGHIVFSIAPRLHRTASQLTIVALLPLAYYCWAGWLVWAILLRLSGVRHPEVPEFPALTKGRRWLAFAALLMLVLTFIPAPFGQSSLQAILREYHSQ